ncbi:helix-turn-helix domain-containing protein [Pseudanabaenaceae cyanobacterium LEGE 13415]|nr:helix-turn-helix domain-containing protein [Pseudanabaenaceae cyanobacterium LEGE 13415]
MGKAGKVLAQVLTNYSISQGKLAEKLGIARSNVHRWVAEIRDPNSETVQGIIAALREISPNAADEFISLYASDLAVGETSVLENDSSRTWLNPIFGGLARLPETDGLNIAALSRIFDKTTTSYKYVFFLSLLDILRRRNFDAESPISLRELLIEILVNAWYPHTYFKLSFGLQDKIAIKLDSLELNLDKPAFDESEKEALREEISKRNLDNLLSGKDSLMRYVPFRLIAPFLSQQLKAYKSNNRSATRNDDLENAVIVALAEQHFDTAKPLYKLDSDSPTSCKSIYLCPEWVAYIRVNYSIVKGWVAWEWLQYMQSRNPSTPAISSKLFPQIRRGALTSQTKYWQAVLEHTDQISCIYSNRPLRADSQISLDHYLPWSFVAHDQIWNLIPTFADVNSSKSKIIPSAVYFDAFVRVHHLGLKVWKEKMSKDRTWNKFIDVYISDLRLQTKDDLTDFEKLSKAYSSTFQPLMSLATSLGFEAGWNYSKN